MIRLSGLLGDVPVLGGGQTVLLAQERNGAAGAEGAAAGPAAASPTAETAQRAGRAPPEAAPPAHRFSLDAAPIQDEVAPVREGVAPEEDKLAMSVTAVLANLAPPQVLPLTTNGYDRKPPMRTSSEGICSRLHRRLRMCALQRRHGIIVDVSVDSLMWGCLQRRRVQGLPFWWLGALQKE